MGIEYSSVVDAPRDEVFAWHGRPGAIHRLLPPWQPMSVVSEATSLADGRAVLGLPGGLRWNARHRPEDYAPPAQFVDELRRDGLRSLPAGLIGHWRHEHRFDAVGSGRTRVTDCVDTPVPGCLLRQMFFYRHRQLSDDVAAHQWSRDHGARPESVAVTGSSGLIGSALTAFLSTGGYRVIRLVRHEPRDQTERRWDPESPAQDLLDGIDAVVHLAGASIAGRFSEAHKNVVCSSRIEPTRRLAECAAQAADGPSAFVSASAIGWYGHDRADEQLDESAQPGDGFLARVVADWEAATAVAADAGLRVVTIRTGIVQTPRGGTLRLMRPLFAAGLGGPLGGGRQWLSWIDIEDLVDVYHRALVDAALSGPVNAVAPDPVRNIDYTRSLAAVLHRPAVLPVPAAGPALLLGSQGARELAMASQRVVPGRLIEAGHRFRRPTLQECLRHQLGHLQESS
ncbi:MAG: TIGR01777 family oxidoreductase [Mycobacterium sp.]